MLYGLMHAGEAADTEAGSWYVEADPLNAPGRVRRLPRARLYEERAKSASVAIASSLFLVLLAAALLVGGHAAIDPLLRSAVAARDAQGIGDLVYTMPDGIFCRHMSFDNETAQITEGALEHCPDDAAKRRVYDPRPFAWGRN